MLKIRMMRPYHPWHTPPTPARARVWPYYVAYTVAMAIMYLAVIAFGVVALAAGDDAVVQDSGLPPSVMAVILIVVGLPLLGLYAAAPFLPKKPWAWTYHVVLIAISLTSACCMVAGIPLLIFWVKPETKAMFGRQST